MTAPHNAPDEMPDISEMTDREIAEETLYWLRQAGQALTTFQNGGMRGMIQSMTALIGSGRK